MESSSKDICYICLQEEHIWSSTEYYGKFYTDYLCECKGSIKIHWKCLYDLMKETGTTRCGICKEPYDVYLTPELYFEYGVFYRELPHEVRKYYNYQGYLLAEGTYLNSFNGMWNLYYQKYNGTISRIKNTIQQRGFYNDGIKHGQWTEIISNYYNTSKVIEAKGTYVNGFKEGHWTFTVKETGVLHEEGPYVNGQKKGHWKHYDSGVLEEEGECDGRNQIGWWKYYSKLGHLLREHNWDKYECKYYYTSRKLHKHECHDKENNLYMKSYYESGAVKETVPYKGRGTTLYPNGELKEETMYNGDTYPKREGTYKLYSKTGKVLIDCEYNQNKHGPYKAYYESGKLKEEGSYFTKRFNANKHGLWKTYDESGNLIKEETYDHGKLVLPQIAGKKRKRSD